MQPQDFRRYLRRTVLIPVVLLAVVAVVLLWQINYMINSLRLVDRADQVISDGRLLMRLTLDMESGLRGYLLTGDERFLEPYYRAQEAQQPVLKELRQTTVSEPDQTAALDEIESQITLWRAYADRMIQLRKNGGDYASSAVNLEGKRQMDAIRVARQQMLSKAQVERQRRTIGAQRATRNALFTLGFLTLGTAIILVVVTHHRMTALSEAYTDLIGAERHQTDEARSNREWLLTILRSIGDCVIATDPSGLIEFLNPAAEELTGWSRRDARSRPLAEVMRIFDERTSESLAGIVGRSQLPSGGEAPHAVLLARKDGQKRVIEQSTARIIGRTGELHGFVVVFRDITERRRAEAVLRSSEKLALVGRLSATIAHEIQNPLDSVMNLLYLIENSPDTTGSSLDYARTAQEELQRITQITRQLLSFNREAREPISIDIAQIIDSVHALLAAKMTASGIELIRDYRTHRHVFGLPGELRQVFSNLIVNAVEASAPGGKILVRIQEMTERLAPGRPGIQITISDTGKGIPASDRSDLFTPFFTTKGEKGTGLGLWVSRGIIAKHQGHMRFRSCTVGAHRGTTFSVFLPLEQAIETPVKTAA